MMQPLDDDGPVWSPVEVRQMGHDWFRAIGGQPEVERWMFPPGSIVRCARRTFQGDPTLRLTIVEAIIVEAIEVPTSEGNATATVFDA